MTHSTFRERLEALRKASGLNAPAIGKAARLSPSAVGHYLSGRRPTPDAASIVALARVFGVSTDYLLTGGEEPSPDAVYASAQRALAAVDLDPNSVADEVA